MADCVLAVPAGTACIATPEEHTDTEDEKLWHDRLARANIPSIRELANRGVVNGLDLTYSTKATRHAHCAYCAKGKQHKCHMRGRLFPSKHRGEMNHSDVCGPMTINSVRGSRYFVTFIDEYSGYVTVACIYEKSDVQLEFKK